MLQAWFPSVFAPSSAVPRFPFAIFFGNLCVMFYIIYFGTKPSCVKQGPKWHKPWPIQKVMRSHENYLRKSWEIHDKGMRKSRESHDKVMRKSWDSHETVMRQSSDSHKTVMRHSWDNHETLMRQSWDSLLLYSRFRLLQTFLFLSVLTQPLRN